MTGAAQHNQITGAQTGAFNQRATSETGKQGWGTDAVDHGVLGDHGAPRVPAAHTRLHIQHELAASARRKRPCAGGHSTRSSASKDSSRPRTEDRPASLNTRQVDRKPALNTNNDRTHQMPSPMAVYCSISLPSGVSRKNAHVFCCAEAHRGRGSEHEAERRRKAAKRSAGNAQLRVGEREPTAGIRRGSGRQTCSTAARCLRATAAAQPPRSGAFRGSPFIESSQPRRPASGSTQQAGRATSDSRTVFADEVEREIERAVLGVRQALVHSLRGGCACTVAVSAHGSQIHE